jgi:hypothetical protein
MSLNRVQEISLYMWCIDQGVNIEYGKLSLCDLRNFRYSNVYNNRQYQVHCEDSRHPWSMIYDDLHIAVIKFIELKSRVRKVR